MTYRKTIYNGVVWCVKRAGYYLRMFNSIQEDKNIAPDTMYTLGRIAMCQARINIITFEINFCFDFRHIEKVISFTCMVMFSVFHITYFFSFWCDKKHTYFCTNTTHVRLIGILYSLNLKTTIIVHVIYTL